MIYIDTGAFIARYIQRDQYHQRAQKAWEELNQRPWRCYTSNFVLDETFTLLARRTCYTFAAQRARALLASEALKILRPTYEDELNAVELFEKFADQSVSFTDCVSFALMRKRKIWRVFTFDQHFMLAGFAPWPEQEEK